MNPGHPVSTAPAPVESEADGVAFPIWLIVLMFLLLYWGAIYFDQHGGWFSAKVYTPYHSVVQLEEYVPRQEGPDPRRGGILFEKLCATCHGSDGAGKPGQSPPLAGSEWVTAKGVNRLVRIPVLGLAGPIEVNGKLYDIASGMTAVFPNDDFGRQTLTDSDLADVLSYIRQAWGNKASLVTVDQVKTIRDEIGKNAKQLTVKGLLELPEEK